MRWFPNTNFGFECAFTFTLTGTSVAVTFPTAFPTGATVVVICTPTYATSFYISAPTTTGFTFYAGTTAGTAGATIHCHAFANA